MKKREYNKIELYYLMHDDDRKSVNKIPDDEFIYAPDYILYNQERADGTGEVELLTFGDIETGELYTTESPTFIKKFSQIVEILEDDPIYIIKKTGISKNGRTYVTCTLDKSKY